MHLDEYDTHDVARFDDLDDDSGGCAVAVAIASGVLLLGLLCFMWWMTLTA